MNKRFFVAHENVMGLLFAKIKYMRWIALIFILPLLVSCKELRNADGITPKMCPMWALLPSQIVLTLDYNCQAPDGYYCKDRILVTSDQFGSLDSCNRGQFGAAVGGTSSGHYIHINKSIPTEADIINEFDIKIEYAGSCDDEPSEPETIYERSQITGFKWNIVNSYDDCLGGAYQQIYSEVDLNSE